MTYHNAELYYLMSLMFTVGYCLAMLIYLNRIDGGHPTARALQRLLIGIIAWGFYDVIMARLAVILTPEDAFFWFRFLSFMWINVAALSADLCVSLFRKVTPRLRLLLYTPFIIMYLAHLALPQYTNGRVYGISVGWSGFPTPYAAAYQALWGVVFIVLGVLLFRSARRDPDPWAKREKYLLLTGILLNVLLLHGSRVLLAKMGPGFPATGNLSMSIFAVFSFFAIKNYGRVLSPQMLYRTTVDNIPLGLCHIHHGVIIWTNKAFRDMTGVGENDLAGRELRDLIASADTGLDVDIEKVVGGEGRKTEVTLGIRENGVFSISAAPLAQGNPMAGFLVVFNDITDRKKVENDLRESQTKYYTAFRLSPVAMTIANFDDGRYVDANEGVTRMYGYPLEDVLDNTAGGLGVWRLEPEKEEIRRRILEKEGAVRHFEFDFLRADGEKGTGLNFAEIIDLDRKSYILSMTVDITERKKAEEELRNSEEQYRTLLDASPFPVAAFELSGRALYVNSKFTKVLGWTLDDITDQFFVRYIPAELWEQSQVDAEDAFQGKQISDIETVRMSKDGRRIDVRINSAPLRDSQGTIYGLIAILEDISEAKRHEEEKERLQAQLRQSQKMEAVGTLASGVSHDFNNILQLISGNTQIISDKQGIDPQLIKHVQEIDEAVERARDLIKRLLTFSRKVEPELRPVDLNNEMTTAVRILERIIPKMIEIKLNLSLEPCLIMADANQINQLIMNLATNARDAMPNGGTMAISSFRLTGEQRLEYAGDLPTGDLVMLTVSDDGEGMSEETKKHIFNPFYTTKEIGKGAGLGLSTVYGIVESHGGRIIFDSSHEAGTVFRILWPALPLEQRIELVQEEDGKRNLHGPETILLVDDESGVIEVTGEYLELNGYKVMLADRGEAAVEIFRQNRDLIDLIVMDLGMPGIGGLRALNLLRGVDPGVRVVIASGYVSDNQVKEAMEAGAAGFVGKPYRLQVLLEKVREILDRV